LRWSRELIAHPSSMAVTTIDPRDRSCD
jgi:hypothetical protein